MEGEYNIILNAKDEAVCITQTTRVYVVPFQEVSADHAFQEVSADHAFREGENDRSLDSWRAIHRDFFTQEMNAAGLTFDEDMPVVCEDFLRVYP